MNEKLVVRAMQLGVAGALLYFGLLPVLHQVQDKLQDVVRVVFGS